MTQLPSADPAAAADSAKAATHWFARMRSDQRSPEDEAEFNRWLTADPVNERAYLRLQKLWAGLEPVRGEPEIMVARARALDESQRAVAPAVRLLRPRRWLHIAGVAAAAAGIYIATDLMLVRDVQYQTQVGDRRTVQLADGSELTLNTDSIVRVRFGFLNRNVLLQRGQAHFKVAHNPLRPFLVDAGTGTIRAVGTEFDVDRRDDRVQVTLVEGRIEVDDKVDVKDAAQPAHTVMTAGQEVSLSSKGLSRVRLANVPQATAWLDGRLIFDNERLQDALAEMNRYSDRKLVVLDPALANFRVSGVFRIERAESFIEVLRTSLPVTIVPGADGELVVTPEPAKS